MFYRLLPHYMFKTVPKTVLILADSGPGNSGFRRSWPLQTIGLTRGYVVHRSVKLFNLRDECKQTRLLGMILYKMMFLRSPYKDTENYSVLRDEILSYPGYVASSASAS